jgi:hypothetical protein
MEHNNQSRKIIKISKRKVVIAGVILVVLVIMILIKSFLMGTMRIGNVTEYSGMMQATSIPRVDLGSYRDSYPQNYGEVPVADTREFLKTNYRGTIQTRDVDSAMDRAENAVRKNDGRVDSYNKSDTYGSISFVIPKAKFAEFKSEIESFTHKKLYIETVSSVNLLAQKQEIEANGQAVKKSVTDIQAEAAKIKKEHDARMVVLNQQLADAQAEKKGLKPGDPVNFSINAETGELSNVSNYDWTDVIIGRINAENATYNQSVANNKQLLAQAQRDLASNGKQDKAFNETIETVNGSIQVQRISYWNIAKAYSPVEPGWILGILIAVGLVLAYRKNYIPGIELV